MKLCGGISDAGVIQHGAEVVTRDYIAGDGAKHGCAAGEGYPLPRNGCFEHLGKGKCLSDSLFIVDRVNYFFIGGKNNGGFSVAIGVGLGNDVHGRRMLVLIHQPTWRFGDKG